MLDKLSALLRRGPGAKGPTPAPKAEPAATINSPHMENGKLIWARNLDELDQIRKDPNLEAKITTGLIAN